MAWGVRRGVDDLVQKLVENKTAKTMCILGQRNFGASEAAALAAALATNTSLRELMASGHPLRPEEASAFGRSLSRNKTLQSLCLGDNHFGDEGVLALVEGGLKSNVGLLVLDLEYKSIVTGAAVLPLLRAHPTLVDLRLGRNRLAEPGTTTIALGLSRNSTLTRLDLSGNLLNASAVEALGRALFPCPALPATTTTTTTTTALGTDKAEKCTTDSIEDHKKSVVTPGEPASSFPPLEFLDLSRNPLGDEGGAALFRAVTASTAAVAAVEAAEAAAVGECGGCPSVSHYSYPLRSLSLAETGVGPQTAAALAEALVYTTATTTDVAGVVPPALSSSADDGVGTGGGGGGAAANGLMLLKTLDLSKNELGTVGAGKLAVALRRGGAPRLESLSLGYNGVGDDGATAIGRGAGGGLRMLDFSGNGLSGLGLAGVLSASGLKEAKLFHNGCGDKGVSLVLEAVLGGAHIETLDLGANGLTGAGFEALLPRLSDCPSLHTLEVGANSNDDRAEAAVRQSQANNPSLDIAFRRGGEAMEGSGAPPGVAA